MAQLPRYLGAMHVEVAYAWESRPLPTAPRMDAFAPKLALRITAVVRLNSIPQPSLWEWVLMSEAVL
jgi:hypothetical protein